MTPGDPEVRLTIQNPAPNPDRPAEAPLRLPGVLLDELREWLTQQGHERYRAEQIAEWVFRRRVERFEDMTNLAKPLRAWLAERAAVACSTVLRMACSTDGTRKLLLGWPDGAAVETVWIPADDRDTVCVSSQVGCPVGCRFCASGLDGVERNLAADEIVEQVLRVARLIDAEGGAPARGRRATGVTNVVLMGMGEPLANYRNVVRALRILNAPWGLGLGARRITLSTVGLPKQIRLLADEGLPINLALSLHAPDDALRREIIPWAERVSVAELLDACQHYFQRTGRELTLEYVLLAGVNDRPAQARALARIARRLRANVNLLRYNPVPGLPFERPDAAAAHAFQSLLREQGVNSHIRSSRGSDVAAACGQLRRSAGGGA